MAPLIELENSLSAYRADPVGEPKGAMVLIHEIWGLVDHITDVADRFAAEGYLVIAPDILSRSGVSPEVGDELQRLVFHSDEKTRSEAQPLMREKLAAANSPEYGEWAVTALRSVVDVLAAAPGIDGRIAVVGFCFGGSYAFALAAADDRIRAAVPFYGHPPEEVAIARIACPVFGLYGDQDERLMKSLPAVTTAMADAGVTFTPEVWAGVGHAFFNDSNATTYDPDAAAEAWARTLAFLRTSLAHLPA